LRETKQLPILFRDLQSKETAMGYDVYYNGEVDVAPPLTENDAVIMRAFVNREQIEETRTILAAIAASAEPDLPGHEGLLEVSEDRSCILPEEGESRHGVRMWLRLLLEHFLVPRGYVLNGEVWWEGQDPDDRGCIFIKDNQIEAVDDVIFNAGPSWAPNHYADDILKLSIQKLLDSADNAGCSSDLAVVAASDVETVRSLLPEF
jgi:hypothetical protein